MTWPNIYLYAHNNLTYQEALHSKQKEIDELKKKNQHLQKQASYLSHQLQKAQSDGFTPTRGYGRNKLPTGYSDRHQRTLKRQRTEKCSSSLAWLSIEGFSATKLTIQNDSTGEMSTLDLPTANLLGPQHAPAEDTEMDTINMMLYIKDRYNVSGSAYHEMAQLCDKMPRHYKLKERIAELNHLWDIHPTPNGTCGVQQSLKQRLKSCIENLVCLYTTLLFTLSIFV